MLLKYSFAQLGEAFFSFTQVQPLVAQRLVEFNAPLGKQLGLDIKHPQTRAILSGELALDNSLSMVYAGHQFGGFSPQLGDGRGVLLGELSDATGGSVDLHMKGAGPTPYSRRADGRAVLRSCIREYLASEAMFGLSIPTSRALCLFDSQEAVYRETPEIGAMLLRTAKSHIRFGHFEYFYYRQQHQELQSLIDYCLTHYFPQCQSTDNPIKSMLAEIVASTAKMIAHWQAVGFQHGVMNTDNMSILGETIDYGPYGFMDDYQPGWIVNHSDYEGRYAFERQPGVALWNLNCLMRCFSGHLSKDDLVDTLSQYETVLSTTYWGLMRSKLGLVEIQETDKSLLNDLFALLASQAMDYTIFFRLLSNLDETDYHPIVDEFVNRDAISLWLDRYVERRLSENRQWSLVSIEMKKTNPKFILRSYLAHQAIEAAEAGNYLPFRRLLAVLAQPYDEHLACDSLAQRPPAWASRLEVSCSS